MGFRHAYDWSEVQCLETAIDLQSGKNILETSCVADAQVGKGCIDGQSIGEMCKPHRAKAAILDIIF